MQRKPDDEAIGAFFDDLTRAPWLAPKLRTWPRFFFHVTDAANIVSILRDGQLLCRERGEAAGRIQNDNASREVIASLPLEFRHMVRLYFRPRTATFWHNEGICPKGRCSHYDAHCPMPVAMLFDSAEVGGQADVRFSDGNLTARGTRTGADVEFLRSLDIQAIYSDYQPRSSDREYIKAVRQAEVMVPNALPLKALRWIVSRSAAEARTLRTLLDDRGVRPPFAERAFVHDYRCFFGCRTYVERIMHEGERVRIVFNALTETPGPYVFDLAVTLLATGEVVTNRASRAANVPHVYALPHHFQNQHLRLDLLLDGFLAFAGDIQPDPAVALLT